MSVFELDSEEVHKKFKSAHAVNELEKALRAHLQHVVPHVYCGLMSADAAKEELKAKKYILKPFEVFLCDGNPETVFQELKNGDNPSHLCGKVFKLGEPTYSCRDCGMDPTCVLCIDCFQGSAHKDHRYRMSTSGGGGYCDCGDIEAWKSEPFCQFHKKGASSEKRDPLVSMDQKLRRRADALFTCLIRSATELMRWEYNDCLPQDLRPEKIQDTYVTMLFNDEVHTYEQVINALTKAVNADSRQAVQFATTVDREGRSPVKDGDFKECEHAKEIIIRQTTRTGYSKPLKTSVMHSSVVAFQIWAMRTLTWLQEVTNQTEALRKLFCHIIMDKQPEQDQCILEQLLLADTQLWKGARVQVHELIMSGVLLDQECKKKFAILFTKMYPSLMQAFMGDDHDHTVCAVSQTVQIFTVPTLNYASVMRDFILDDHERKVSVISSSIQIFTNRSVAKMLIAEHSLLSVILNTFLDECKTKANDHGTFAFEKQTRYHSFRRAQYALHDLKYALTSKPNAEEWNNALRENFIAGFECMLQLLKYMQNMDSVTRQVGQHIQFDPEWETAFNLQLKLENDITMILDWCGTDKAVLLAAYRKTLECLWRCESVKAVELCDVECAGHRAHCIQYDVSRQPVSAHVPINRILAGLFAQTAKFNMSPSDLCNAVQSTDVGPELMMERCLRVQVLLAQSQANMWKRNGYSLINQLYFYQNVRCRTEMFDRDVLMIQTAAALLDSDHFILHLLNKFGLTKWKNEDFDTKSHDELTRYTVTLAEEFLNLLLLVVGERYAVGVGQVTLKDVVMHEIVHQLCLHPMPHSELSKNLPEDPYHETGIDPVVLQVANFKKPSSSESKGLYELKDEFHEEYNPFFYHFSRQEQSAAMDAQRARHKQQARDVSCTALCPPCPPPFTPGYAQVANILNCDVMHYVMNLVLTRGLAKRSKSWSETQYEKVLFLIGLALHEEKRALSKGDTSGFRFVDKARVSNEEAGMSMYAKLEEYLSVNKGPHQGQRDILTWVVKMFGEVRQLRHSASGSSGYAPMEVCVTNTALDEKTTREREKKAKKAAARRAKVMAQMSRMQKNFIQENTELFETTKAEIQRIPSELDMDTSPSPVSSGETVALGPHKSSAESCAPLINTCILCQEEQECTNTGRAMVLAAFVQKSTVLSQERGRYIEDGDKHDPTFMPSSLKQGTHANSCGHVMHADCWQGFYDNVISRERRRAQRFRHALSYDLDNYEYLCPYCKALSNTVIPIISYLHTFNSDSSEEKQVELSFCDWASGLQNTVQSSIQQNRNDDELSMLFEPCPLSAVTKMMQQSVAQNFQMLFNYRSDDSKENFSDNLKTMIKKFSSDAYTIGLGVSPDEENARICLMVWSTCAYSIVTAEQILRLEDKAVFEEGAGASKTSGCLAALIRHAAVCTQVISKKTVKKHCVNLLSALLWDSKDKRPMETPCILDMDIFHYLMSLCMSLPTLYAEDGSGRVHTPSGGLNDLHCVRLVVAAHLCQVVLTAQITSQDDMETDISPEAQNLFIIFRDMRNLAGIRGENTETPQQVLHHVTRAVLPFLRCCAIFFQLVTAVAEPVPLKEKTSPMEEFRALCKFLGLPTHLSNLFSSDIVPVSLIQRWCSDPRVQSKLKMSQERGEPSSPLVSYPLPVNQLVQLPADYSELINKVSAFTCPNSNGDESRAPTMCLVCGEMLCSQSYCCQTDVPDAGSVGAATAHANTRGAGTCVFLRVRDCQILLLTGKTKGCFYPPPYLDDYGETDQGLRYFGNLCLPIHDSNPEQDVLRRGNPLRLCKERYDKLQKLWLSHAIAEQIARHLESNAALLTIEWNHL